MGSGLPAPRTASTIGNAGAVPATRRLVSVRELELLLQGHALQHLCCRVVVDPVDDLFGLAVDPVHERLGGAPIPPFCRINKGFGDGMAFLLDAPRSPVQGAQAAASRPGAPSPRAF